MKVLVACEESQRVCIAFRELGHEAYSCDIIECSGGHPEWHIQSDVLPILNPICNDILEIDNGSDELEIMDIRFKTMDGIEHIISQWDIIIAFPPCTYLTVTGNRWFNVERYGEKALERIKLREEAAKFFMSFVNADCDKIAIENPIGYMNSHYRKPDQIIQPYMFGDPFEKRTCLWLKGLPKLEATDEVTPPARQQLKSGKSMPEWYSNAPKAERSKIRSKTFPGFAKAMAEQWGE